MTDMELAQQIIQEIRAENVEPAIRFTLEPSEPGEPGLTESKAGGTPYLPREMPWPLDGGGQPMQFLAQVNCAELKGLPDFPESGLLQFFTGYDDVFGANFDNIQNTDGFRVLYHENIDPTVTLEEVQAKSPAAPEEDYTPILHVCRICFGDIEKQGITDGDYRFNELFLAKWNARRPDAQCGRIWDLPVDWDELLDNDFEGARHQMGGYPYFTQTDPRWGGRFPDLDVLLFQLDSDMRDSGDLVLWGDCGAGNFFISREALQRKDFSRTGYNWDCC